MSQVGMEHDQHQEHGNGYPEGNGQWLDNNGYHSHHQSSVPDFNGYAFSGMPMEPVYSTGMGPPLAPRTTHQQLQPLIMPQWPSMLTSQSSYVQPLYPSPAVPLPPASTPISATSTSSRTSSTPRKTLTDADRRRMCQYHEDHPTVKQTEIGAMFGVERSTVSKVLRQKEKYLYQDDGSRSPVRKSKGKFPDIERALSNWVKNHQRQGLPLTDALIREKAEFFAASVGNNEQLKTSSSWLEKFKQKNGLLGAKSRKSSIAEESPNPSYPGSNAQSPNGTNISPTSPPKGSSPGSMSISKEESRQVKTESPDNFSAEFSPHSHRPFHSTSNASLTSMFSEHGGTSFSPGPTSPTSPFFTPDSANPSPFMGQNSFQQRPRSQTFPMVGIEPYVSPPSSEPLTPKFLASTTLGSPLSEIPTTSLATLDEHSTLTSTSMQPPRLPSTSYASTNSPLLSMQLPLPRSETPGSPSSEEAARALEVVMTFFQNQPSGFVEPAEYMTIGKLMEKLKLQRNRAGSLSGSLGRGLEMEMPGGMHRIAGGDFLRKAEGC